MNKLDFEIMFLAAYPNAMIDSNESGDCTWMRLLVNKRAFSVQVTLREGIGVSEIDLSADEDFLGHDAVFENLEQVFEFLEIKLR